MSTMIEGLEARTLFSLPPVVAAEITSLREQGTVVKAELTSTRKGTTADYRSLVDTLKANGVFKEDHLLLATLSKESARYRTPLTIKTNQMVAKLNSKVVTLVHAVIALDRHSESRAYAAFYRIYSRAYSQYLSVEETIGGTLIGDRDTLGSVDEANLNAIANANPENVSISDEVASIVASSNTGVTTFTEKVDAEVSDATTVVDNYL